MRTNVYAEELFPNRVKIQERVSDGVKYVGLQIELKTNVYLGSKGGANTVTFWVKAEDQEILKLDCLLQNLQMTLANYVAVNPPDKKFGAAAAATLCQHDEHAIARFEDEGGPPVPESRNIPNFREPEKTDARSTRVVPAPTEPVEILNPKGPTNF